MIYMCLYTKNDLKTSSSWRCSWTHADSNNKA